MTVVNGKRAADAPSVHHGSQKRAYSTVTVLAKLRGLSTSRFLAAAT